MLKYASHLFIFLIILCKIKSRDAPEKCICITTKPYFEIECQYASLESCDKSILNDLQHLQIPDDVTLINCAERTYFSGLINRLNSATSVKLRHLSQENPRVTAISGNMKKLELKSYTLQANTFDDLPQLNDLTISFSRLKGANPFQRLPNLYKLDLSFNGLMSKFEAEPNLIMKYNIEKMQFNILNDHIFESLENLRQLNLGHNSLLMIQKEVFQHLVNVEEIDFSYNFILAVDTDAFVSNAKLRILNLRNNKIKFNEAYGGMIYPKSLEILDLRSNNLSYFLVEWAKPTFNVDLRNNNFNVLNLQVIQNALAQNVTYDVNDTSECYTIFNDAKPRCKNTIFLSGNPVALNTELQNLVNSFNIIKTTKADFSNWICVKTERYLCLLHKNRDTFCPRNCACFVAPWESTFIVNCTKRLENEIPKLNVPKFWKIEVHLEENSLKSGPKENIGFNSVAKLYLSNNNIEVISWIPENLEILEIHNNNLGLLNMNVIEALNKSKSKTQITLHNNPWRCNCEFSKFVRAMQTLIHHKQIDARNIRCGDNNKLLINLTDSDLCPTILKTALILLACFTALGLVSSGLVILYYRHGYDLKVYLFAKKLYLPCVKRQEIFAHRRYDAFICYTFKDEDFVSEHLLRVLESGSNPYKICIHVRDWIAGELITHEMIRSIEQSKRTIVVMSPDYLKSNWAMMEMRFAYDRAVEGNAEIIIILYRDINVENIVDEDLKQYLKTCHFIKWNKPRFWDKLKYALPHL